MFKFAAVLMVVGAMTFIPHPVTAATCPSDSGWKSLTIAAHSYRDVAVDTACSSSGYGYLVGTFKQERPRGLPMRIGLFDPSGNGGDWGAGSSGVGQVTATQSPISSGVWTMRVYNDNGRSYRVTARLTIELVP